MTPRGHCHPCLESLVPEQHYPRDIQATNIILDLKSLEIAMLNKEKSEINFNRIFRLLSISKILPCKN